MAIKRSYMQALAKVAADAGMDDEADYLKSVFGDGEDDGTGNIDNGIHGQLEGVIGACPPEVETETLPCKVKIDLSTLNLGVDTGIGGVKLPLVTMDGANEIEVTVNVEIHPCWTMLKEMQMLAYRLGHE